MKRTNTQRPSVRQRAGFSLIELMVVIVVIGVLMALLLPAIQGVQRNARLRSVSAEITQLDQAISKFKAQYGVEPPSSLLIPAAGDSWDAASRSKVRSIWPQFDFDTRGGLPGTVPAVHLSGAECLVFFLGGVQLPPATPNVPPSVIGFSKDPRRPWSGDGSNREGPYFEFDNGRLVDIDNDGALEYLDSLPDQRAPYLYFSSQGKAYNKQNSGSELDDFDVHGGASNSADMSLIYLKNVRTNPSPPPPDLPGEPQRQNSYQIISPGFDGQYGIGGVYTDGSELVGVRAVEADNITNFSNGVLRP